jgi:GntR family transcriptional regulator
MFQIDFKNRKPIYEQIAESYKRLIMAGAMKPDERVMSVRDMAKALTCNPNTVQKAYRELETQGYFYTVAGQGNFISAPPDSDGKKIAETYRKIRDLVNELLFLGETRERIMNSINGGIADSARKEADTEGGSGND